MAEYSYSRELVSGKYNISFTGEKVKLHEEITIALPGKTVSYVNCNGVDVKIGITTSLDLSEKSILDTVVQDHKDNYLINIIYCFKLTEQCDDPSMYDINLFGLHRNDIINNKGSLITKEYYKNYDGVTYLDLVVKDSYIYTIEPTNDLVQYRDETITWYLEDDTVGTVKTIKKYYDLNKAIKEGMKRRTNLMDIAKAYGLGTIVGIHASGVPNSHYYFSTMHEVVDAYITATNKQEIIDFINNATETYITQTVKDTWIGILDYWTV